MVRFLLVEDDVDDAFFVRKALGRLEVVQAHIEHVETGDAAISWLGTGAPDMVLLDLNLPGAADGFDVLRHIKADVDLRRVPVFVLSSSDADVDVRRAYDEHANGYLVKPGTLNQLVEAMRALERFWFRHVTAASA